MGFGAGGTADFQGDCRFAAPLTANPHNPRTHKKTRRLQTEQAGFGGSGCEPG